jgi:hypothetical protein
MDDQAATQHWIQQGGGAGDQVSEGHAAMWQHAQEPSGEQFNDRHNREIEDAVGAAVTEVKYRDDDKSDWDASRKDRDEWAENYPQADLSSYIENKLSWHRAFQQNPSAAREAYVRAWSKSSPFHPKPIAPKVKQEPPSDLWQDGRMEFERQQDVLDAVRSSSRNRDDAKHYESTAQLRQLVKERTGLSFSDFMSKARAIDAASLNDPSGIASRFAVFSGEPATEMEAQELQAAVQHQAATQQATDFLQAYEASGQLPQDYKSLESEVAVVLQEMSQHGARSGDMKQRFGFCNWVKLATAIRKELRPSKSRRSRALKRS